jgi:hypothetical protein
MTLIDKLFTTGTITDEEIWDATGEQIVIILTQLPSVIESGGFDGEVLERVKTIATKKLNKSIGLSYFEIADVIDGRQDISQEAKDGIKKVLNMVSVFHAHEKLYNQMKDKDKKTIL